MTGHRIVLYRRLSNVLCIIATIGLVVNILWLSSVDFGILCLLVLILAMVYQVGASILEKVEYIFQFTGALVNFILSIAEEEDSGCEK